MPNYASPMDYADPNVRIEPENWQNTAREIWSQINPDEKAAQIMMDRNPQLHLW
jgi:hypothetical protein